ncbi:MAG: hypothetical protein OEV21_00085 [Thermoplasmata archaeon]|nr:hypothetical protein [Thermoplasmata archaeon]
MSCCCNGAKNGIKRIKVGNQMVGIVGYDFIIGAAKEVGDAPEAEIKAAILEAMRVHNYVPKSVEKEYVEGMWQEYLKIRNCC